MKWKPGQSGNPKGVPPGNGRVSKLLALLESHQEALIAKVIELALEGDVTALKLCLDKLIPNARHEYVRLPWPEGGSLTDFAKSVLKGVGSGEVSTEAGSTVLQAIRTAVEVVDAVDYHDKLDAWREATQTFHRPLGRDT